MCSRETPLRRVLFRGMLTISGESMVMPRLRVFVSRVAPLSTTLCSGVSLGGVGIRGAVDNTLLVASVWAALMSTTLCSGVSLGGVGIRGAWDSSFN